MARERRKSARNGGDALPAAVRARLSTMPRSLLSVASCVLLVLLPALAACAGPGERERGTARVLLSREGSAAVYRVAVRSDPVRGTRRGVPLEAVSGLQVRVEGVELRRATAVGTGREGPNPEAREPGSGESPAEPSDRWVSVELRGRPALDLMNLPVGGGVELARGSVPAGEYDALRLSLADPVLTLNRAVVMDDGSRLEPGEHPLLLPAPDALGLRVQLGRYRVRAGERSRLVLEFLERHSAATLKATPAGLLMRPVLTPGRLARL